MSPNNWSDPETRLLAVTPSAKDAVLTESLLSHADVACVCCSSMDQLSAELDRGVGAVLVPEETATGENCAYLKSWLNKQPAWSDLPVLVLARHGADSATVAQAMDLLGNVTVLERPMRISALVSTVRSALRARQRQYQIRDYIQEQESVKAELKAADRKKDEFLAILAHELRNPLSPIRHSLYILGMKGGLEPETEELRQVIERQVDQMVRLVDDLLEVSRITSGKIDLRRQVVDIASVVQSAIETSRPLLNAKQHQLQVSIPSEAQMVEADPMRLAQVFSNLLTNAAKYTDPRGAICLEVEGKGDWIEVAVEDDGTGISPDMLTNIFDMFTQVDGHSKRAQGGLGIGLTLVKKLVELHGGNVYANSLGLGKGSRFVVTLPRSATQEKVKESVPAEPGIRSHRFLVVDDNRDAASILGVLLRMLGAEVKLAHSGQEALEVLKDYRPSAALLDIGMPDMSGHELAVHIRENPDFKDLKLIALSGWGQEEVRRQSLASGFNHHLVKPVDLNVLEHLLDKM